MMNSFKLRTHLREGEEPTVVEVTKAPKIENTREREMNILTIAYCKRGSRDAIRKCGDLLKRARNSNLARGSSGNLNYRFLFTHPPNIIRIDYLVPGTLHYYTNDLLFCLLQLPHPAPSSFCARRRLLYPTTPLAKTELPPLRFSNLNVHLARTRNTQ